MINPLLKDNMAFRIRYESTPHLDVKRSVKNFSGVLNGRAINFYVLLNETNFTYSFHDVRTNDLIMNNAKTTKNRAVLLRQLKRDLESLGVSFALEERKKNV